MIQSEQELIEYIELKNYDAIVVEGYDGVGKGRVLDILSNAIGVTPYRPDYNFWMQYDHRKVDRWKVSGFFWDIYTHFSKVPSINLPTMLFDRGVISGSVYNHDRSIARNYKKLLGDSNVLHILVFCNHDDFVRFHNIRGLQFKPEFVEEEWNKCLEYTNEYRECLELSGVEYITYYNHLADDNEVNKLEKTCAGCGHYSYGICRHPKVNSSVSPGSPRCNLSVDSEVQDIYDNEMQCV